MGEGLFDKLAAGISAQERLEMLERIKLSVQVDAEPIVEAAESDELDLGRVYGELSFFGRVWLAIRVFLTRSDRITLLEEIALRRLGTSIERRYPLCFSVRRLELGPAFFAEIQALAAAMPHLVEPLRRALGKECREFVALLASIELPAIHDGLAQASELPEDARSESADDEMLVRQEMLAEVGTTIDALTADERALMQLNLSVLRALERLASFPYDRILGAFDQRSGSSTCALQLVVKPLQDLSSLLSALRTPPGIRLLEALFLFSLRDEASAGGAEKLVSDLIRKTNRTIEAVRSFNSSVPLTDILRFALGELEWAPVRSTGGEDWLALYRQYWTSRVEDRLLEYSVERRRRELVAEATAFVNLARLPPLPNYRGEKWRNDLVRRELSLGFIVGFINHVFARDINRALRIFLIDGRFYKEKNRADFTECYNRALGLPEEVARFDANLAPTGEWGRVLAEVHAEPISESSRQKRLASIFEQINNRADELVTDTIATFGLLANLMFGILHGTGDSIYDTISNRTSIGGRENQRLLASLAHGLELLRRGNNLLSALLALERGEPV